jgi:NADH-quinone oxidoreductase subunit G/NADP-reducing hydrogenase subunit HndD
MFAALRKLGFDYVFDSAFGCDLLVNEQAAEFYNRLKEGTGFPMFSSCCPAWIKYVEQSHPDMLANVSACKSPQQMLGALITNHFAPQKGLATEDVYSVSAMPCIAKKFESQREQMTHKGVTDVDLVLTTRELARLIRLNGIDIEQVEPELSDQPYQSRSSAGKMLAVSGGLTEALIRTLHFIITGKDTNQLKVQELRSGKGRKEYFVKIGEYKLGFAVVNGIGNIEPLMNEIKKGRTDIHYIEVMACEGGCVGGGGQPIHPDNDNVRARAKSIYELDEKESIRVAHQNASLQSVYETFLIKPGSEVSHAHLFTSYEEREVMK